ncbi:WYL domain-containing protein [Amycolatopsis sp.]|uniref:helix-turn-helix transcriptional regulator n=1 Tax=Amycolatopsis sp. TaxID=37632 RepID=UPI002E075DAC|nr:WYL domain-containing protein [Amycolatopsis sp.]
MVAARTRHPARGQRTHCPPRHRNPAPARLPGRHHPRPRRRLPAWHRANPAAAAVRPRPGPRGRGGPANRAKHDVRPRRRHGAGIGHPAPGHAPCAAGIDGITAPDPAAELLGVPRAPIDPAALTAVGTAVRHRHLLVTETLRPDGTRPEPGDPDFLPAHRIEPHRLVVWAARWYLVAYDLTDHQWRVHRVDRLHPRPTTQHFSARALPGDDLAHFVMSTHDRGDTSAAWQCTGTARLNLPAHIVARWAPGGSVVEHVDTEHCRLTLGAWSWAASPASSPPSIPNSPASIHPSSSTRADASHADGQLLPTPERTWAISHNWSGVTVLTKRDPRRRTSSPNPS